MTLLALRVHHQAPALLDLDHPLDPRRRHPHRPPRLSASEPMA